MAIAQPEVDLMGEDTGELPEGWVVAPLMDLCHLIRGVSYAKGEETRQPDGTRVALLRANNIGDGLNWNDVLYVPTARVADEQRLKVGDVLLAMSSGSKAVVGKAATLEADWDGTFGAFCGVLRSEPEMDWRFFGLYFQTAEYRRSISEASVGVNINNLKLEYFRALSIPFPPLAEQKRIVEKVEQLLAQVNAARGRLANVPGILKALRQSVLAAACSGRLTADWREEHPDLEPASELLKRIADERKAALGKKYREPDPVDTSDLPDLPEGWEWTSMGHCFEVCVGGTPSRAKPEYWDGPIPWVSSGEIQFCRIRGSREAITEAGLVNSSTKLNPAGTVLLGMIGEGRTRGQAAILDLDACSNQNSAAIRVSATPIPPEFVYYWVWSQYEVTRGRGAGNEQPALNKARVERIPLPMPPVAEQHEIVRRVEGLFALADSIEQRVATATLRAEKLTQAILAKAFRGELVPTEAELAVKEGRDYEPASVLLERITAECACNKEQRKARSRRPR